MCCHASAPVCTPCLACTRRLRSVTVWVHMLTLCVVWVEGNGRVLRQLPRSLCSSLPYGWARGSSDSPVGTLKLLDLVLPVDLCYFPSVG